ncbi:hypothetical protein B0H15DRAFT_768908 [Mycena belliarum]|uniref:Uncharacterized protein n=1 Tax=Mycena belliarum TaxID=1033014 RepID=A0AAD6UKZ6_9AGAR|nr:hypothetical protein B0H15DRAFT_768908 [Mycena belliae]
MSDPSVSSTARVQHDTGTSYPSPVSTAGSPNIEESTQPLLDPHAQGRPDAQHSLRAASAALQAAYRRIRQVRRSLVELTEPLPPSSDAEAQYLSGNIGPGHSALLLGTSPIDESSDTDDAIDFQSLRSNLAAVDRQTQEYLDRFAPSSWSDHHQPHSHPSVSELPRHRRQPVQLPSPSLSAEPIQHNPIPRRSMLETQLARRRELLNPDDPSTFIGRRVAAREAAGPSRSVEQSAPPQADLTLRAVELERELIHLRALSQQRRTDPGRADAMSRSDIIRAARSLDIESFRAGHRQQPQPSNISTSTNVPSPNPRRWRAYRTSTSTGTRQNSNTTQSSASARTHPDRLSILSNFSVQNLSTPTSAVTRDRPLLFEEPFSYTGQRRDSRDIAESPIGSERSYFIHRRVNADGDELVHNINLEWDEEDPLSWLMPGSRERPASETPDYSAFPRRRFGPSMFDDHENVRRPRVPPPLPEPRRRGWARLDADGNAIPSDEEEELERTRAEYRIRALYQARASAAAVTARAELRVQSSVDVPPLENERSSGAFANLITRTSIAPDDYPARETTSPRVRLNSRDAATAHGQRTGFGSVIDSVLAVDSRPRQAQAQMTSDSGISAVSYGSTVPFVMDPLPIPLCQMMPLKNDRKGLVAGTRVARHAAFAGR